MTFELKNAVVIDDALGPPATGTISSEDKNQWVEHIISSPTGQAEIRTILNRTAADDNLDKLLSDIISEYSLLMQLWDAHKNNECLEAKLDTLFFTAQKDLEGKARAPNQVISTLSALCASNTVLKFSDIQSGLNALSNADIAFLDFYLDDQEDDQTALKRIKDHAEVLKQVKLLFIMSSRASLDLQQQVRQIIGTRTAFFDVIQKKEITNDFLSRKISYKTDSYKANKSIENLIDSLVESAKNAIDEFTTQCQELEIHDLNLLNLVRLEAEGESIQEYLNWLFSEAIAAKTRRNVIPLAIDNSSSIGFSGQIQQGRVFFTLFAEVVFGPPVSSESAIRFGELLIDKTNGDYFLILSPACDLQRCELNHPVLCVKAKSTTYSNYKELAEKKLYGKVNTGGIRHLYCIKSATAIEYVMLDWLTSNIATQEAQILRDISKFDRVALMNETFAQELKEEVLRNLGRVGTQIDPPPPISLQAKIRWKNGSLVKSDETPENQFIPALMTYAEVIEENKAPTKCQAVILSEEFKNWIMDTVKLQYQEVEIPPKIQACLETILSNHKFILKSDKFSASINDLKIRVVSEGDNEDISSHFEIALILPALPS